MKSWKAEWKPRQKRNSTSRQKLKAFLSFRWIGRIVRSQFFWEKFAILVSTSALIATAMQTAASRQQVELMQAQLTAADVNATRIKLGTAIYSACNKLAAGPVRAFKYDNFRVAGNESAPPFTLPVIEGKPYEITPKDREIFGMAIEDTKNEIGLLFMQASMFGSMDSLSLIGEMNNAVENYLTRAQDLASDYRSQRVDIRSINRLGHECMGALQTIINRSSKSRDSAEHLRKIDPDNQFPALHTSVTP
ncbi:hypothetical protein C8J32_101929 [Rhizobium sp. PP-CC-3A-592]|nr:hypothetical protein C8J32_101929 [Rhizobium sp. PP-CC-3A-592]